jgi:hypothetical protein
MKRFTLNLVIAGLLGLALTVSSLGYSVRTHYGIPSNPPGLITVVDYSSLGFPLPWVTYCNAGCCDASCSLIASQYPAHLSALNAIADYIPWFLAVYMLVLAVDYALATGRGRNSESLSNPTKIAGSNPPAVQ